MYDLPKTGFLRINHIIGDKSTSPQIPPIIPVSSTTWWEGIRNGLYPKPVKLSKNISAWRVSDIQELVDRINLQGQP